MKKGTLLAKLNDAPLQAELKKLEAQMPLAQDRVYRQEQLLEREAVSLESYESVYTELEKLKADLELVKARIAQTELRAPFDGIIGLRNISEGAYASPSTIIARLTQVTPLRLEFSVNEHLARDVKPGTRIAFTVDKDNSTYYATVYAVDSRITMSTYTLTARATYPNNNGELSPGNYASIRFSLSDTDEAIIVPSIAMLKEMGRDLVYVYESGIARQKSITIGSRTASSVEVMEGLNPGDTLITSGVMQLRDGMPVNLSEISAGGVVQ